MSGGDVRRKTMIMLVILCLAVTSLPAYGEATCALKDMRPAATVNGVTITRWDLEKELAKMRNRLANMGKYLTDAEDDALKRGVLEKLINEELLAQDSLAQGIAVDEMEIERAMTAFRNIFVKEGDYRKTLESMNKTEDDIRLEYIRKLRIRNLISKSFQKRVTIGEAQIKSYYESRRESLRIPEKVHIREILATAELGHEREGIPAARKKIEMVRELLEDSADFASLAKQYSDGENAAKGGDVPTTPRGGECPEVEEIITDLKPGGVSGIIEIRNGYRIIKVEEKIPSRIPALEEVRAKMAEGARREEVNSRLNEYVCELRKKAKIERYSGK